MSNRLPDDLRGRSLSRRELLGYFGMLGGAAFVSRPAAAWARTNAGLRLIDRARRVRPAGGDLEAIDHIVFLMMENRSYDHYFGDYRKGRGFDDHPKHSLGAFAQDYPGGSDLFPKNRLLPFHLDAAHGFECTDDLTHDWGPQHLCWDNGTMGGFVRTHTMSQYEGAHGTMTMGYYQREDLPFYYALADSFTLCDAYHCSILGPTHPNRLMANSGTIDPQGGQGGPITQTNFTPDLAWNCTWPTMQEVLQDAGVSWKVYSPSNLGVSGRYSVLTQYPTWSPALYDPITNPEVMAATDHVLPYFTAFRNPLSPLYSKAFTPTFPNDFVADVRSGTLPSVSWLIPPLGFDEHPSSAPANGMWFTSLVLDALVSNPEVWSRTALFLMYDENDGFFDHVPPPTAPRGTPGEYLTAPLPGGEIDGEGQTLGITGPLGLGMRVPMLVISPFSRGGHVAGELFDHTSQLKLVSARFGVEVPNVSKWRRRLVGDLTSTMFHSRKDQRLPCLPRTDVVLPTSRDQSCQEEYAEAGGAAASVPTKQRMPTQGGGSEPASRYYREDERARRIPEGHRTQIIPPGPGRETLKSSYNRLAKV